jgi:hypothetical protein
MIGNKVKKAQINTRAFFKWRKARAIVCILLAQQLAIKLELPLTWHIFGE